MRDIFAITALILSLAAFIACSVYHVAIRPEWTQAMALRSQWPILLGAVVLAAIGCRFLGK